MDPAKRRRFELDTQKEFPRLEPLSASAAAGVRHKLASKLALPNRTAGTELSLRLREVCETIGDRGIDSDRTLLASAISRFSPGLAGPVLLNWGHWLEVDRMECRAVIDYFDFLWYPKVDDLDILDEALRWIVSVDHDGWIYAADLRSFEA
jgi:hypothetical protein